MCKKIITLFLAVVLVNSYCLWAKEDTLPLAEELLCDLGREFYQQGKLEDAQHEFEKVIIINPKNKIAILYLEEIKKKKLPGIVMLDREQPIESYQRDDLINQTLDKVQKYLIIDKQEEKLLKELIEEAVRKRKEEKTKQIIAQHRDTSLDRLIEKTLKELESKEDKKELPEVVEKIEKKPTGVKKYEIAKEETEEVYVSEAGTEDVQVEEAIEIVEKTYPQTVLINEEEFILKHPPEIRQEEALLPLKDIARGLSASVVVLGGDKYKIITSIAKTQDLKIESNNIIDNQPYISLKDLDSIFQTQSVWDPSLQTIAIKAEYIFPAFTSYTLIKPTTIEPPQEEFAPSVVAYAEDIPEAAKPSLDLKANTYYNYRHTNNGKPYRSSTLKLSGSLFDYSLYSYLNWQDINNNVEYNTGYIDLYKKDFRFSILNQSINLSPLRSQSDGYTGIKVFKEWDDSLKKTKIYAGETETSVSGTSETVKYLGNVYAIEQEYVPKEWFSLRGMALAATNEAEKSFLSGTTSFPKQNLVFFGDSTFKLPQDISLFGQLASCNYIPDDSTNTSVNDINYRIGGELNKEKLDIKSFYEYAGDRYASVGTPASYQNYKGWDFNTSLKLTDAWILSNFVRISQDNVDDDPSISTTENKTVSLNTNYNFPTRQSVTISYSAADTETDSSQADSQESRGNLYRMDFMQPFGRQDVLLSYEYYDFNADISESDYDKKTYSMSIFRHFSTGSYLRWRGEIIDLDKLANDQDTLAYNNEVSLSLKCNPKLTLTNDISWDYTNPEADPKTSVFSTDFGIRYLFNPDASMNVVYSINNYDIKKDVRTPDNWSILGNFSLGFDIIGSPNFGKIMGRVVQDINGNKIIDFDEPGIADISVRLADGRKAETDSRGYFSFDRVVPGEQKVILDFEEIPIEMGIEGNSEKTTFINARQSSKVEFLLVEMGYVEGRLFIDENKNGTYDSGDQPVKDIIISLLPVEKRTITNTDGLFSFDYLYSQEYVVQIDMSNLTEEYILVSPEEWRIKLPIGGKVKDVNFLLKEKPLKAEKFGQ